MTLATHLNMLESFGLIRLLQMQPELEYLFRHALVQDAAYQSLVRRDRMHLHQAVGEALEQLYPTQLASRELAPLLARHFDEAGDDARALKYFALAGDAAAQVYANAEAAAHYARAIDMALSLRADGNVLTSLYTRHGRVLELSARDGEALRLYEEMENVAHERSDRAFELAALLARATVYLKPVAVRDPDMGKALSERALALARELGEREAEAKALWNLMLFHKFSGRMADALLYGEQALALARELDLREQIAYVLNDIYAVYFGLGQIERWRAALDEAQRLWRELGILNMLADSLAGAASLYVFMGDYQRALALSDEALRVSRSIGNLWNQSYSLYMIDLVYLDRGEMGRAIEVGQECIRLAEQAGFIPALVQARIGLALIYGGLGDLQRGFEAVDLARATTKETFPFGEPLCLAIIAHLHLLNGNPVEAEALLNDLAANNALPAGAMEDDTAFFIALFTCELLLAQKDYARVIACVDEVVAESRRMGVRLFLADLLYFKGQALLGLDRMDEAHAALTEARAEAEAIGSRRSLWPILMAQGAFEAQRGNEAEAEALRRQAREIVEYIAEHAGSPELRASFLNLPDVREVMRETA